MTPWLQTLTHAILLGGLYALVAMGLSIGMGVVRVVNLAHGHMIVLGSYFFWAMATRWGVPYYLSVVLGIPLFYLLGVAVQAGLLNRLSAMGEPPQLLTTLGLAVILENLLLVGFSPDARRMDPFIAPRPISCFNVQFPSLYLMVFFSSVLALGALYLFFYHTLAGKALRAASDNEMAAKLCGIPVEKIRCRAMGLATVTAMAAGFLIGIVFTFYPHTGGRYLLIAFGVGVIGGIGSIWGSLVGGFFLAFCQLLVGRLLGPGFQEIGGFMGLLLILSLRPRGLLGRVG